MLFVLLRFLCSTFVLQPDEAEQYLDAVHFEMGFDDQPPLFSWIVKLVSLAFGLNPLSIALSSHLIMFAFFLGFYFLAKEFWEEKKAFIVTLSLVLFPIFSYEFHRYLVHTILAACIAVFCYLSFIRLLKNHSILNYFILGLLLGLGILAKYNFVVFAFVFLLATLSTELGRKALFKPQALITIITSFLVTLPNIFWLIDNDFSPFKYASERSQTGHLLDNLSFGLFFDTYSHLILFTGLFFMFFYKHLRKSDSEFFSLNKFLAIYTTLIPLVLIFALGMGSFTQRWISFLHIVYPIFFFMMLDFSKAKKQIKSFMILCVALVIAIYGVKALAYFKPDITKENLFIHNPYEKLLKSLDELLTERDINLDERRVIVFDDVTLFAALKAYKPKLDVLLHRYDHLLNDSYKSETKKHLVVWKKNNYPNKKIIKKLNKKAQIKLEAIPSIEKKYRFSTKLPGYQLGIAVEP